MFAFTFSIKIKYVFVYIQIHYDVIYCSFNIFTKSTKIFFFSYMYFFSDIKFSSVKKIRVSLPAY
jgi:hypothetical protein